MIKSYTDDKSVTINKYTQEYPAIINDIMVKFQSIDSSDDKNTEVMAEQSSYDVQGYPSIIMLKDGKVIKYEKSITVENLQDWVEDKTE
jgi:hypothetical protein